MPVCVRIPIRLRVDPGALSGRQADLAEALAAAAGRALRNSRAVVLEHRGGYEGINLHPPTFSWCGEAVGRLDNATRLEVEALVADVLRRAAEDAGVLDQARAAERLPLPFTATSGERLDPSRYFGVLGLYAI